MKSGNALLSLMIVLLIGVIAVERVYISKYREKFKELEKQRIITSNKLATAKIVRENLNHVRELIFENMDFQRRSYSQDQEDKFFKFVTECVNDLKLKLISARPLRPSTQGRITTFPYDLEIEGDFFRFGELCAKFENSRRIISVVSYQVALAGGEGIVTPGGKLKTKGVRVTMRVNTHWIKKN